MIKSRQLSNELSDIISSILENGLLPYYNIVMNKLKNRLNTFTLGEPEFLPKLIEEYTVSQPEEINKMFNFIYKDLKNINDENNLQAERVLSVLNYYHIEVNKILHNMERQNLRIDKIKEKKEAYKTGKIITENFNDFLNIDLERTNCLVDLRQNKAYNKRKRKKINISNSQYKIIGNPIEELSEFKKCLNDIKSDSWIAYMISSNSTEKLTIEISLSNIVEANSLQLESLVERKIEYELLLSFNNKTTPTNKTILSGNSIEWKFDRQKIDKIIIKINKLEADGIGLFYYGIENISLFNDKSMDRNILVSNKFNVNNITTLLINATELLYPSTEIYYDIEFENEFINKSIPIINNEELLIPEEILLLESSFTGTIRLIVTFYNSTYSPEILNYNIVLGGNDNA